MTRSGVRKLNFPEIRKVFSSGVDTISSKDPGVGVKHAVSTVVDYYFVLSMVLGGCCAYVLTFFLSSFNHQVLTLFYSNVWAYEMLLNQNPRIGESRTI